MAEAHGHCIRHSHACSPRRGCTRFSFWAVTEAPIGCFHRSWGLGLSGFRHTVQSTVPEMWIPPRISVPPAIAGALQEVRRGLKAKRTVKRKEGRSGLVSCGIGLNQTKTGLTNRDTSLFLSQKEVTNWKETSPIERPGVTYPQATSATLPPLQFPSFLPLLLSHRGELRGPCRCR